MPLYTVSYKPSNIANLKYWIDASDLGSLNLTGIGTVTASVLSIRDKVSGTSIPSVGSSLPLYYFGNINNCNSVYFQYLNNQQTAPNDLLSTSGFSFSTSGSLYTVTKWGSTSSSYTQWAISIAPSSRAVNRNADFQVYYLNLDNFGIYSTVGPTFTSTVGLFNGYGNGTSSDINSIGVDIFDVRYNSNTLSKFNTINPYNSKNEYTNATYSLSSLSNKLTIGDYYTFSATQSGFKGYFCEMLYYTRCLNDDEHNRVIQYLKGKWIG